MKNLHLCVKVKNGEIFILISIFRPQSKIEIFVMTEQTSNYKPNSGTSPIPSW